MSSTENSIDYDAPAILRKWPSLNNERRDGTNTYTVVDGTLKECIHAYMARPERARHLYEIHTAPQSPLVLAAFSGEIIAELARLREFL